MELASSSFPALGSQATVSVHDPAALAAACALVEREIHAIDRACSRFREDSELSRANTAGGRPVGMSPLFLEALEVALRAARLTDGIVDPTVGQALRRAGYDRDFALVRIRDASSFRPSFSAVPGWQTVEIDREHGTVRLPAGVELDLGATAKALAADRAAAAASAALEQGVLVSLGGDVAVAGTAPEGGWPVRVADDHAADRATEGPVVTVTGGGLATSSTTVRRWRSELGELHHVIDPRTGRPARTPWLTVTVAAGSTVDANVASTAAIVLGEQAPAWLERHGLPARLRPRDGAPIAVAGWPEEAL